MIKQLLPAIFARYPKLTEEQKVKTVKLLQDLHKAGGGSGALALMGGIAVGTIVASVTVATLGLISGAGLIWLSIANGLDYGHGMEFARKHGCIAHLMNDKLLRRWQEIIGHKAVLGEIQQAYQEGIEVTGSCRSFARQSGSTLTRTKLFDLPKEGTAKGDADGKGQDGAAKGGTDGKTKGDADGKAQGENEKVTKDVLTAYFEDFRCTVLCAPPRTGKGIVAAGMMMGFKAAYPAGVVFSCTIKQFAGEDWYFHSSDYHINPDRRDPVSLAKQLYQLYRAWECTDSSKDAPSLFVLDEVRDTLLAIDKVKMEDIDPSLADLHPSFADWVRGELISAATLNQCHKRFTLLISPVSTAQAMGFKDANSLNSYASYTLATPSELAFTEGNNGTFAAPAIRPDSPLFEGWYGLAWAKKTKQWLGVPTIDKAVIQHREDNPPKLNYLPANEGKALTAAGWIAEEPDLQSSTSTKSKARKVQPIAAPPGDEERWESELDSLHAECCQILRESPGKEIAFSKLVQTQNLRKRHGDALKARLSSNANITCKTLQQGGVIATRFMWVENDDSVDEVEAD